MKGIKNKNNQQKLIAANLAVIELQVQLVKTKLSCETSLQNWKWKLWKKNRARPPSQIESWRSEKKNFRARHPSKSQSWRCENEAFVRDIPPKVKVEDVKAKFSCKTFLQKWKLDLFAVWLLCCVTSLQWDFCAVWRLCCVTSLQCDFFAVGFLCSGTSVLCGVFAVWRLWSVTSLLWDFFAVWFLCCETF